MDLCLISLNTSCGTYLIARESTYTAKVLSVNNETERVPLLWLTTSIKPRLVCNCNTY